MSRFHSYIHSATQILSGYKGQEPFSSFVKKYFAANKKFGSKDRREVSSLCYSFFRLGNAATNLPVEERILAGKFLCASEPDELLQELKPEWNNKIHISQEDKLQLFDTDWKDVFTWQNELSDGVEFEKFAESFFIQPDLFIRLRPGHEKNVKDKLINAGIAFEQISPTSLSLPTASKLETILELNKEAVIQDFNSQRVGEFFDLVRTDGSGKISVWDCCAASGGKSILAKDILGDISLTASDIRENIISNLRKRFKEAGIINYTSIVADLTGNKFRTTSPPDLIIADVPCTGSGTWARTPEQNVFFKSNNTDEYVILQRKIMSSVIPALKPGGYILYITCSVFKKENEEAVEYFIKEFHLQLVKMELLKGYSIKADTMFAALLHKPL
jgi:16S rRNA (cytosine967-C5)-methyltransferase